MLTNDDKSTVAACPEFNRPLTAILVSFLRDLGHIHGRYITLRAACGDDDAQSRLLSKFLRFPTIVYIRFKRNRSNVNKVQVWLATTLKSNLAAMLLTPASATSVRHTPLRPPQAASITSSGIVNPIQCPDNRRRGFVQRVLCVVFAAEPLA
jgi:hypothetical protein